MLDHVALLPSGLSNLILHKSCGSTLWPATAWYEGPNKTRVLAQCLILAPDHVPCSVVVSRGSILGGNGQPWSAASYILDGHFPYAFPPEEDHVPADGNPHPIHGMPVVNPNVVQHWHNDVAGAAQEMHADVGINNDQMQEAHNDLLVPPEHGEEVADDVMEVDVQLESFFPEHPQDGISFAPQHTILELMALTLY